MSLQFTRPEPASDWPNAVWRMRYGADAELRFEPFDDPDEAARARADLAAYNKAQRRMRRVYT